MTSWKAYERFIAMLLTEQEGNEWSVIPNAKLQGRLSDTTRQIDVLIDCRFGHRFDRRVIIDAKRQSRPIDVKQVEEFEGMMRDVAANKGILVCPNGHTAAALRRAQDAIEIRLVSIEQLETLDLFSWDECADPGCKQGLLLWDATPGLSFNGAPFIVFATAKCDECGRFNVWCWECGNRFAPDDEDEYQCACRGVWFWLTSIEDDGKDGQSLKAVYLLLIAAGQYFVVDRRPLR